MIDYEQFMAERRACLIAPAGCGKTHAIVECLKCSEGRQLVVTHTNAGVAVLRDRIRKAGISHARYKLETISSVAQKLALSYAVSGDTPPQENTREYFPWVLKKACEVAGKTHVKRMMNVSFSGVFVDEYQDCTVTQHRMLTSLAGDLPMRVLGDPMQGIFDFSPEDPIVDFEGDLREFKPYHLTEPWRWKSVNPALGEDIFSIRECLERGGHVNASGYREIRFVTVKMEEAVPTITRIGRAAATTGSTLIVVSDSRGSRPRVQVAKYFGGQCGIIEAIDDREFYESAAQADQLSSDNCVSLLYDVASRLFFKSQIDNWLKETGVKRKRDSGDAECGAVLAAAVDGLRHEPNFENFGKCLEVLRNLPGVTLLEHEKFLSIIRALRLARMSGTTAIESMRKVRNQVRMTGRRLGRFSVGSTLLTKGLEFDNVIVLDCNPGFRLDTVMGRRNFYVAVSRARRSLTVVRYDKNSYFRTWIRVASRRS